jgi:hypothetical protein
MDLAVGTVTVRFYMERKDAINVANRLTVTFDRQFRARRAKDYGWLVHDAVDNVLYDIDGKLPPSVGVILNLTGIR